MICLEVGDQILSINNQSTMGINREHAVNILRSAAATNQVQLHVRHFLSSFSSKEDDDRLMANIIDLQPNDRQDIDLCQEVLQALLNSTFQLNDLLVLMKKVRPTIDEEKLHKELSKSNVGEFSPSPLVVQREQH